MRVDVIKDIQTLGKAALPHLWKDEIGDVFILTKRMEIYVYSKTVLGCYSWSRKTYLQLQKSGVIFDVQETDDHIYFFKISVENMPLLFSLGAYKRRPHKKGRWVKSKEKLLGHRILPLNTPRHKLLEIIRQATVQQDICEEAQKIIGKRINYAESYK